MNDASIVVMESGAGWQASVDEEAGPDSSVVVLSRHRGESVEAFESRARSRLGSLSERVLPRRGVLVCGSARRDKPFLARERLLLVLCEVVARAGGGEVVLIGDDATPMACASGYASEPAEGSKSWAARVSLRFRPGPGAGPVVARRVA